jgi:uncharacterized protein (UPF0218 family)
MISFKIDARDAEAIDAWMEKQRKKKPGTSTIGGRWSYVFTPTGLGTMLKVVDNQTKKELVLDHSAEW